MLYQKCVRFEDIQYSGYVFWSQNRGELAGMININFVIAEFTKLAR